MIKFLAHYTGEYSIYGESPSSEELYRVKIGAIMMFEANNGKGKTEMAILNGEIPSEVITNRQTKKVEKYGTKN